MSEMLRSLVRWWAGWQKEVGRRALPHSPALGALLLLRFRLCSLILVLPPPLPPPVCLQYVLWGFHCLSLLARVVIPSRSHSIFNMFSVSGFQLKRLVALIAC